MKIARVLPGRSPFGEVQFVFTDEYLDHVAIRRRSAEEMEQRVKALKLAEAERRARLPICVCCDMPRELDDFMKRSDGSLAETCRSCGSRKFWQSSHGYRPDPYSTRMTAINNRLFREIRNARRA